MKKIELKIALTFNVANDLQLKSQIYIRRVTHAMKGDRKRGMLNSKLYYFDVDFTGSESKESTCPV